MNEQQPQSPEVVSEITEYPLGAPLTQEQLHGLVEFAIGTQKDYKGVVDAAYVEKIVPLQDEYTPELGGYIVQAFGDRFMMTDTHDDDVVAHITQTEQNFQREIVDSILSRDDNFFAEPEVTRHLVGDEVFLKRLEGFAEKNPIPFLGRIHKLERALPSEMVEQLVAEVYATTSETAGRTCGVLMMCPEVIVRFVDKETIRADIEAALASDDFKQYGVTTTGVRKLVKEGLATIDEMLPLVIHEAKSDSYIEFDEIDSIVASSEDVERHRETIRAAALEMVSDKETGQRRVASIARFYLDQELPGYNREVAEQMIATVKETHGVAGLLESVEYMDDEALVADIMTSAFDEYCHQEDDSEGVMTLGLHLHSRYDRLAPALQQEFIATYAVKNPTSFLSGLEGAPYEEGADALRDAAVAKLLEENDSGILSQSILSTIMHSPSNTPELRAAIRDLWAQSDGYVMRVSSGMMKEYFPLDEMRSVFTSFLEGEGDDKEGRFGVMYTSAKDILGLEEAKALFLEQAMTEPLLGRMLLKRTRIVTLENQEVVRIANTMIDGGEVPLLMSELSSLFKYLPADEMIPIFDRLFEWSPEGLTDHLGQLSLESNSAAASHVIGRILDNNPAHLLTVIHRLPGEVIEGTDVISYIENDERYQLAPKYFSKLIRKLPKADATTAFFIMAKEAGRVYDKLRDIHDSPEAVAMLDRISDTLQGGGERAELESISLASIVLAQGEDPEQIRSADDAKRVVVNDINDQLGTQLDSQAAGELEQKLGSLTPLDMYLRTAEYEEAGKATTPYLREIVEHVNAGDYRAWRYGDKEELVKEGLLPRLTDEQYRLWQQNDQTESHDRIAGDVVSIARQIQEVVSRGLVQDETIQRVAQVEDHSAAVSALQAELGGIGKQIGDTYRRKQTGVITPEMAERQVAHLEEKKQQLALAVDILRLSRVTPKEVAEGVLYNEKGRPTTSTIEGVLGGLMERYGDEAVETFTQLSEALEQQREAATTDIGRVSIREADDFQTTFEIGANPVGSCQHYEHGQLKRALLGYFEPSVKLVTVRNERDRLVARAVTRLASDEMGMPLLVLEPLYTAQPSDDIAMAVRDHVKAKAAAMGIDVYVKSLEGGNQEATLQNYRAPYIYSDTFNGVHERDAAIVSSRTRAVLQRI